VTWNDTGYQKTLEAARASEHMKVALKPNQGRGIASRYWHNAGGESSAAVNVTEDGMVTVAGGHPDIGGSRASMAMVVAEVLSIPFDHVRPVVGDTTAIGFSASTGRSRVAFAGEMAVTQGSRESDRGTEKARRDHVGDQRGRHRVEGWQRGPGRSQCRRLRAARSCRHCRALGPHRGPISAEVQINAQGPAPSFTTHICDVEVDPEAGYVKILRYTAIQDWANPPLLCRGPDAGRCGAGRPLGEPGCLDYRVPVYSLPMINAILIEVPNPRHPFWRARRRRGPDRARWRGCQRDCRCDRAAAARPANVAAEVARGVRCGRRASPPGSATTVTMRRAPDGRAKRPT
jgi:hypothetical protein